MLSDLPPGFVAEFTGTMLVFFLIWYLFPIGIAAIRRHPQFVPLLLLNLFLGWTFLGWLAALIWSCWGFQPKPKPIADK